MTNLGMTIFGLEKKIPEADDDSMPKSEFFIGSRKLGVGQPCYVIAEIGSNFNGDFDLAKQSIDAAIASGADAVKFQTFKADEFVAGTDLPYSYQLPNGEEVTESQYEMFKKLELPDTWHIGLRDYAVDRGADFLSSAADERAVDLLISLDVPAIKVASEDLINHDLLRYVASVGRPVLLSTGMADEAEIEMALKIFGSHANSRVLLMHCTSAYPTPPHACNLRRIGALANRFNCPVGFSDHTLGWEAAVGSVAMGSLVLEKHFTMDQNLPGPDHQMSTEPKEFAKMVQEIQKLETLLGESRVDYDPIEEKGRVEFRRSIVAARNISVGEKITDLDLSFKRVGYGLRPYERDMIIGGRVNKSIVADAVITLKDVE